MKQDSSNNILLASAFETLVADLLNVNGFQTYVIQSSIKDPGYDLIFADGNLKGILAVKLQKSKHVLFTNLRNQFRRLAGIMLEDENKIQKVVLVLSAIIEPQFKERIVKTYGVNIIDRYDLYQLSARSIELRSELTRILKAYVQFPEEELYEGFELDKNYRLQLVPFSLRSDYRDIEPNFTKGKELLEKYKAIEKGFEWRKFEEICFDILRYLFGDHLSVWEKQNSTDDDLHRFDLICRISSTHDFWKFLIEGFDSRFIIFEFKNYTSTIGQKEIYSTEKYLYKTAFRNVAFIIAKNGYHNNAAIAAKGSLRENGKLIFILDSHDIKRLLKMKDLGEEPSDYISEKLDSMLMTISK